MSMCTRRRNRERAPGYFLWAAAAACVVFLQGVPVKRAYGVPTNPDDADIVRAVETELLQDSMVSSRLVDVESDEGIVTLTGFVDTLLAKERAAEVAQAVRGVRSVINQIRVRMMARPDGKIRDDVLRALAADPATDSYEMEVTVQNGKVLLAGEVDSWQEKQLAADVARSVKGVTAVSNGLTFDYEDRRPDGEVAADIRQALEFDARVDSTHIDVSVDVGRVVLDGVVGSTLEKTRAYADSWVVGVKAVDNKLTVAGWSRAEMARGNSCSRRSDGEIEEAIRDAFLRDPRVTFFHPAVEVDNDVAVLTGVVDNLKAKMAAEQDAENTICIWRVKSYLKVRPHETVADSGVAERVRTALRVDPLVSRYDIALIAANGVVTLTGTVDSPSERVQAEDAASRVHGVVAVKNRLAVSHRWTGKTDREIKEDVKDQLWWSPYVDSDNVKVSVDGGVVTLTGFVDSWAEYRAATDNAYEGGARRVRNQLKFKGATDQS